MTTTGHLIILYAKSICFAAAETGWEQAAKSNEGKCLREVGDGQEGLKEEKEMVIVGGIQPPILTPVPVES